LILDNKLINSSATPGSWIKDSYRRDRSLGFVMQVDEETGMMYVNYPKLGKGVWVRWANTGHYAVICK